jgi:hypothetical protein
MLWNTRETSVMSIPAQIAGPYPPPFLAVMFRSQGASSKFNALENGKHCYGSRLLDGARFSTGTEAMSPPKIPFVLFLLLWMLFAISLLLVLSPFAIAQVLPVADTFVSSSNPKLNYGTSPILVVQPGATAYIKFDLCGFPVGPSVSKTTLRLYVYAVVNHPPGEP